MQLYYLPNESNESRKLRETILSFTMASDSFRIPARKYHSMTFLTSQIEDRTDEASQGDLFIERIGIRMEFTQIDIHLIQGCFDRSANRKTAFHYSLSYS